MQIEYIHKTHCGLKSLMRFLVGVKLDFTYVFLNYFVASLPCWTIRKLFYRAAGMKIGKGSRINMKAMVLSPDRISIGERTIINEYSYIDGRGGLTIGSDVSISVFSMLITGSHDKASEFFAFKSGPITIEDNVWVCSRAIILENSVLKYASIIGANSVFKGITEKGKVYGGNPAKEYTDRNLMNPYQQNYKPYFR